MRSSTLKGHRRGVLRRRPLNGATEGGQSGGNQRRYRQQDVVDDYLAMHAFIVDILDHMTPGERRVIEMVMEDTQPGWDKRRQIAGRLFPNHVATTVFEGMRYDWQLERN